MHRPPPPPPPPPRPTTEAEVEAWVKHRFGVDRLREQQAAVILGLLSGRRVLFVAPTGHGKSLCYQALAANPWTRGLTLVFQPLKALMNEQVEKARRVGLRAERLHSDLEEDAQVDVFDRAGRGELDILFIAPERLDNPLWQERVPTLTLKGVVVDEAHCISQWGHDFRPAYRQLVRITLGLGLRTPVLAVTATAPPAVVDDITEQLHGSPGNVLSIRLPSHRANLTLLVGSAQGFAARLAMLAQLARQRPGEPGLAYFLTTGEARLAAEFLSGVDIPAVAYHGGLDAETRSVRMAEWTEGDADVICATSALGMGMDRADLRWVAHLGLPDSLIRYVQEIGRAGRDGRPAVAVAVNDPELEEVYGWFLGSAGPLPKDCYDLKAALVRGPQSRTQLVARTDIPETTADSILRGWVRAELCTSVGKPATYTWIGGSTSPIPEGREDALALRRERLVQMLRYAVPNGCRARRLAEAMGDPTRPDGCGLCDVCTPRPPLGWTAEGKATAERFLAQYQPAINLGTRSGRGRLLEDGRALAIYRYGVVGNAVRAAKYDEAGVLPAIKEAALRVLQEDPLANLGALTVVHLPSQRPLVAEFATWLAGELGAPVIAMTKTRRTEPQKRFRSNHWKKRNIEGSLAVPALVVGTVLLVDDLWDSGETIKEAARTLHLQASNVGGHCRIHPLVLARTRDAKDES